MTGSQANFLQALGWAILNSLWQLALLWVVYQGITAVFRNAKSSAKSSLASSLLIAGFGWFLYTFFFAMASGKENITLVTSAIGDNPVSEGINSRIIQALPLASSLYLILLIIPLVRFTRNYRYVQVIRRYGLSRVNPEWKLFVNRIALRMGIRKQVQIWVSEWVSSPVTIGFLKPVILVPLAAVNHLSTSQMEAVLLHELSHIRRYDYLVNLVLNIIRVVLYFNPFAKAFVRIVEREREKSCDEMVLQFQYDAYDYSKALLALEKVSHRHEILVVPAAGRHEDLLRRVETMMGIKQRKLFTFRRLGTVATAYLLLFSLNAFLLFNKPANKTVLAQNVSKETNKQEGVLNAALIEQPGKSVRNRATRQSAGHEAAVAAAPALSHPAIIPANYEITPPTVILDKFEEAQVKEAISASKKVLENEQWQQVEKNLADVFNEQEKAELKSEWKKELEKFDWQRWEDKLRQAYDQVDWEKVNTQLNNAISKIQVDSLTRVYNNTILNLRQVQRELNNNSLKGIPDTDITLKEIAEKQRQVQKALLNLKATRVKKIVHL